MFGRWFVSLLLSICLVPGLGLAVGETTTKRIETDGLSFAVPSDWVEEQPTSMMRKAQLQIPAISPDTEAASLVVYYFGQNQGGSVEANLKRWEGQFAVPADLPPAEAKQVTHKSVAGMELTTLELAGTYIAPLSPRTPNQRHNKPNYQLFAAVVTTPHGNFFFKSVGPKHTMAQSREHFGHMIDSLQWKH